jgi:hypothetical protein
MEEPGEMSAGSFLFHDTFTHTLTIVIPDVAQRRSGTGEPPTRGCNRLASISKRSCLPDPGPRFAWPGRRREVGDRIAWKAAYHFTSAERPWNSVSLPHRRLEPFPPRDEPVSARIRASATPEKNNVKITFTAPVWRLLCEKNHSNSRQDTVHEQVLEPHSQQAGALYAG